MRPATLLLTVAASVTLIFSATLVRSNLDASADSVGYELTTSEPNVVTGGSGPAGATDAVVAAAHAFLGTLSAEQRNQVSHDVNDPAIRDWSNLPPANSGGRNGVPLKEMTGRQQTAALSLAEAVLSDTGYAEMRGIMAAGDVLNARGNGDAFDSGLYYFALFGEPHPQRRFTVQIGGHHLAVNTTYENRRVSPTPAFTGIDPLSFSAGEQTVTPLRDKAEAAFGLLASLDEARRRTARLDGTHSEIVVGPGADGTFPAPAGIPVSALNTAQRDLFTATVRTWIDDTDERVAAALQRQYETDYDRTRIAWSGSTDATDPGAYLRIDGPRLWIEFSNQGRTGSGDAVHYHTVYRDKLADYAGA